MKIPLISNTLNVTNSTKVRSIELLS